MKIDDRFFPPYLVLVLVLVVFFFLLVRWGGVGKMSEVEKPSWGFSEKEIGSR